MSRTDWKPRCLRTSHGMSSEFRTDSVTESYCDIIPLSTILLVFIVLHECEFESVNLSQSLLCLISLRHHLWLPMMIKDIIIIIFDCQCCPPLPDSRATCTSWNFSTGSTSRRNLANASAITCTLLDRQTILKSKIEKQLPAYYARLQKNGKYLTNQLHIARLSKNIENVRKITCTLQVTKIWIENEGLYVKGRAFWSEKVRKSGGVSPHLFCDNGGGDGDGEIRSCHS